MVFVHSVALSNAAQNEARGCWRRREDTPVANTPGGSANKIMAKITVSK
jgi:hypothetical protein